ncbi:MAG: prolipoprotein diacylglyceryl transferase family protein, partial [Fimbriimonadales bacterium]
PTQFYATLMNLIIFALLLRLERRPRHQGQLFGWFLAMHGGYRFINEFFRAGATSVLAVGGLTYGHLVSLLVVGAGLFIAWHCGKRCPVFKPSYSLPNTDR